MCELLISVVDKGDETHWVKRGTVIETFPDGHAYGAEELSHPMFRIVQLPGAPLAWGRAFMGGEITQPDTARKPIVRLFQMDIDHPSIPAALAAYLADDSRTEAVHRVDTAELPALAALKTRRVVSDPTTIGDPGHVIG